MSMETFLKDDRPANHFTEAYPLGNGKMGAMIYGSWPNESISLNEETLWSGPGKPDKCSNSLEDLNLVRNYISKKQFGKASELTEKKLQGHYGESYLPMGNLNLTLSGESEGKTNRSLVLDQAVAHCEFRNDSLLLKVEHFISRPENSFYTLIESSRPVDLNVELVTPLKCNELAIENNEIILSGQCPDFLLPSYSEREGDDIVYGGNGISFATGLAVLECDGKSEKGKDGITLTACSRIVLAVCCESNFRGAGQILDDPEVLPERLVKRFLSLRQKHYKTIQIEHIKDFNGIYSRQSLNLSSGTDSTTILPLTRNRVMQYSETGKLDPALVELYFNFGKYLLISSSRNSGQPANLQGIWNEDIRPAWCSNYTLNINTEMNYWMAEACGLDECLEPLIQFIEELYEKGKHSAAKLCHSEGWVTNHNTDLWRKTEPVEGSPSWAFWPWGGVWLSLHLYDRYDYSRDPKILDRIYPVIADAVRFCCSWFQKDEKGVFHSSPSTSPENIFVGSDGMESCVGRSSAMDLALTRELLNDFLILEKIVNREPDLKEAATILLEKMANYQIDREGILQEWFDPYTDTMPGHRHMSPLFPVYPGNLNFDDDSALLDAAYALFQKRLSSNYDHTGWSAAWTAALAARFKDCETARSCIESLIGLSTSLNLMNSHAVIKNYSKNNLFQIDGNLGGAAAILEMIVSDRGLGKIHFFGGLPENWKTGELKGFHGKGGWILDLSWNRNDVELFLSSQTKQELLISGIIVQDDKSSCVPFADGKFKLILDRYKPVNLQGKIEIRQAE